MRGLFRGQVSFTGEGGGRLRESAFCESAEKSYGSQQLLQGSVVESLEKRGIPGLAEFFSCAVLS